MAKIFDSIKDFMFGEEYDEDDYYDDEEEYDEPLKPREITGYSPQPRQASIQSPPQQRRKSQVVSIHPGNENTDNQRELAVMSPKNIAEARGICGKIKNNSPVVINLEQVDQDEAQRIMDFVGGICFALEGTIKEVTKKIYVIVPESMEISGDFDDNRKKETILSWVNSGK